MMHAETWTETFDAQLIHPERLWALVSRKLQNSLVITLSEPFGRLDPGSSRRRA